MIAFHEIDVTMGLASNQSSATKGTDSETENSIGQCDRRAIKFPLSLIDVACSVSHASKVSDPLIFTRKSCLLIGCNLAACSHWKTV